LTWERPADGSVRLEGHNTDALGLGRALAEDVGDLSGRRVLLVGTGGAARAAAVALARAGASVTVAGRSEVGRQAITEVLGACGAAAVASVALEEEADLDRAAGEAHVVLNATSLGLHGEHLPSRLEQFRPDQIAYDLVYGSETPLLAAAKAAGAGAHDGLGMLVHQASAAFERWSGTAAPVETMRSALLT